jgi:hypothetical protein
MAGSRQPNYAFTYSAFSLTPFAGALADGVVSLTSLATRHRALLELFPPDREEESHRTEIVRQHLR